MNKLRERRRHAWASEPPRGEADELRRIRSSHASGVVRVVRRLVTWLAWSCAFGLLAVWLLLAFATDRWWAATLLSYAPRWVWAGPPLAVGLLVGVVRPRLLWLPLLCLLLVVGPIMGFRVPWRALLPGAAEGHSLRIISCNCGTGKLDIAALSEFIRESQADVVVLQECHSSLALALAPPGWTVDNAWGLCVISRYPFWQVDVLRRKPPDGWRDLCAHYRIQTPDGAVDLFNVHPRSARDALQTAITHSRKTPEYTEDNISRRRVESRIASQFTGGSTGSTIVAGDFNLSTNSAIFRRYWSDYQDAFTIAGWGYGNTWFSSWHGVRIDHVLAGSDWRVQESWVGPNVGSDHRPLFAELKLKHSSTALE